MGKDRRMSRRALHIVAAVLIVLLAVGLYKAKTDAAKAETRVRELQTQIEETEADLRALRAEIAHLESPARVEDLAQRHLGLAPGAERAPLPAAEIDRRLPPAQPPPSR
jgi:cell division protein FtsL